MSNFIKLEGVQGSFDNSNDVDGVWCQNSNYVNEDWRNTQPEEVAEALGEFAWDVKGLESVNEDEAFLDYLEEGKFTLETWFRLIRIWWEAYHSAQELSEQVR